MSELKPCICGSDVEIVHIGNEFTKSRKSEIVCPKCHLSLSAKCIRQDFAWLDEKISERWNTRPIEDAMRAEVELWKSEYHGMRDAATLYKEGNEALEAENARLLDLIGRLAPDDGIWGYIDDEDETCEWCGEYKHLDHEPDCPWLEARKVLEE